MSFNILSLSGGGYLGLYTISVIEKLEQQTGKNFAKSFDLIAGTSIGGIIALALAAEIPASKIRMAFEEHGAKVFSKKPPPQTFLGSLLSTLGNLPKAKYSSRNLETVIDSLIPSHLLIGDLKHRILVPTVNLSKGSPQVFKTPHHSTFIRDQHKKIKDVALATSAAPTFFPMHNIEGERFADGGLYANSPDLLALHEAIHFLNQNESDVSMLSIGTTTSKFSLSNSTDANLGSFGWIRGQRLISAMISSQQQMSSFMMKHRLGDRYFRLDYQQSPEQERQLSLDCASSAATKDLLAFAESSVQEDSVKPALKAILKHSAPDFCSEKV